MRKSMNVTIYGLNFQYAHSCLIYGEITNNGSHIYETNVEFDSFVSNATTGNCFIPASVIIGRPRIQITLKNPQGEQHYNFFSMLFYGNYLVDL
jgi:hypothetical protein